MKKLMKILMISAAVVALGGLILSTAYTHTVEDEVTRLRRESRSDIVYLRTRVRELESELTASLMERLDPPAEAVDGDVSDETLHETLADTATETTADVPDTEAVTVPTHKAPETEEPSAALPETELPAAMYLLTEHNNVIGVFDAAGELVRTANVFVMTLPETEREALAVGIPAYSYEEMCEILEQYE